MSRILVVEDESAIAELIAVNLRHNGFRPIWAMDSASAERELDAAVPDLILLDVNLPDLSGIEVCQRLRAHPSTSAIPIVHLSATFVQPDDLAVGIAQGADGYLTHPVEPKVLIATVQAFLRLKAAERSRASEERYRTMVDQAADAIFVHDDRGKLIDANRKACQSLGYDREELLSKSIIDIDPNAIESSKGDLWAKVIAGEQHTFETRQVRKDGTEFPVEVTLGSVTLPSGAAVLGLVRDISDRKRHELERAKLQAELLKAQKLESVGRLAGGVAHDFNNMLGVILGHAEMALEAVDPSSPIRDDLVGIQKAAERAASLTRQLLAFASKQAVSPVVLDLNSTVEEMVKLLSRLIGENVELEWHPWPDLWPVRMDPSQLDQILTNLCANSKDAIAGAGKVTIQTSNASFDQAYCADHPECVPGDYVLLSVADNGCGMDQATADNALEPFFTTKQRGKGTGLGLATVYGIVNQNHGFVRIRSQPKKGTTVDICLPRHGSAGGNGKIESKAAPRTERPTQGTETVLLVEDEPQILSLCLAMLEKKGYRVLAASTPGEALRLAREHTGGIELLLTDVVMPEMDGLSLANELLLTLPTLRCLLMSGYPATIVAHGNIVEQGMHFLPKPFSAKELLRKVRDVLDGEG